MTSTSRDSMSSPNPDTEADSTERLLSEKEEEANSWAQQEKAPRNLWRRRGIILLYATTIGIFFAIGSFIGYSWRPDLDGLCTRHVSQYSPILKDLDVAYHVQRFNGSLLKENIFRQDAGPEVDAAWEALGVNYRSLRVPPDQAKKSGLLPSQVQINEKYGGGFPANVEGLHQLHCLNLVRQSLYYNFDYYHALGKGAFKNDDYILRHHVSHCLDILRQQLMCTIDIGVLGQVWLYPQHPEPYVDFNTQHRCRNFEAIRQWAEENQLPEKVPRDFLQPPKLGDKIYAEIP